MKVDQSGVGGNGHLSLSIHPLLLTACWMVELMVSWIVWVLISSRMNLVVVAKKLGSFRAREGILKPVGMATEEPEILRAGS
jgi:hypothetical protein